MPKKSRGGHRGRQGRQESREITANLERGLPKSDRTISFTQQYRRWQMRRLLGGGLIALGLVVVLTHVFMHLAGVRWFGLQDLLAGYPMGGLLVVAGLVVLGKQ